MVGDAHAREVESRMQQAGLPPGLLKATGSDPWATMDSRLMMGGMGKLLDAVGRTASMPGNAGVARTVGDVYSANATASDLAAAARDLGLTDNEIAECGNPG